MSRALATIALLILSNTFMTLAWSVTDCGYNPTYQQMLDGETGAESK